MNFAINNVYFMTIVSIISKSDLDCNSPVAFILITFVLAVICLLIGIKKNLYIRKMRVWRNYMLNMPSVDGKIIIHMLVKYIQKRQKTLLFCKVFYFSSTSFLIP